jgi:hypothetical protein
MVRVPPVLGVPELFSAKICTEAPFDPLLLPPLEVELLPPPQALATKAKAATPAPT